MLFSEWLKPLLSLSWIPVGFSLYEATRHHWKKHYIEIQSKEFLGDWTTSVSHICFPRKSYRIECSYAMAHRVTRTAVVKTAFPVTILIIFLYMTHHTPWREKYVIRDLEKAKCTIAKNGTVTVFFMPVPLQSSTKQKRLALEINDRFTIWRNGYPWQSISVETKRIAFIVLKPLISGQKNYRTRRMLYSLSFVNQTVSSICSTTASPSSTKT